MAMTLEQFGIDRLSSEERLELMELICDSLKDEPPIKLSDWHIELLEERIAEADANPGTGIPWETIYAKYKGESQ